ncbi:MAG: hypothetical protein LBI81_01335 [Puniceicoccales bacterium]|jgi:hypothetical protein|nr:hypothetical protein [Puniceicoccales bacterium]
MSNCIILKINSQTENKILTKAEGFANQNIEINENISIVGRKKCGVTGGAFISLKDRDSKYYMAKNLFGSNSKKNNYYFPPNAKGAIRAACLRQTREEVNVGVMQEFIALRIAKIVNSDIIPEANLGEVSGENKDDKRLFLMTEVLGEKDGESFDNFADKKNAKISKDMWKSAFAISVGLLNDQDSNKTDNFGVISNEEKGNRLGLFDFGHSDPAHFQLDEKTLLPKSTSVLADLLLWIINLFTSASMIPGQTFNMPPDVAAKLTPDERKEALESLVAQKSEILKELENMATEFNDDKELEGIIRDFKNKVEKRMSYLETVIDKYEKKQSKATKGQNGKSNQSRWSRRQSEKYRTYE